MTSVGFDHADDLQPFLPFYGLMVVRNIANIERDVSAAGGVLRVPPQESDTMPRAKKKTSDAVKILHKKYYAGNRRRLVELERARQSAAVARAIYELRSKAGLSQRELARLVGTTASVICRLENDDYRGHSLTMLGRIATALDARLEIRFVPLGRPLGKA
jgi:ribosome-binding protein aMBF1 (putative translation factor)